MGWASAGCVPARPLGTDFGQRRWWPELMLLHSACARMEEDRERTETESTSRASHTLGPTSLMTLLVCKGLADSCGTYS